MIYKHIVSDSSQIYFDFAKAENSFIWDKSGKRYIDFTSGWNVTNLGWNHQEIKKAVVDQLNKTDYNPFWTLTDVQTKLAEALVSALPKELDTCVRATGGTEANEEAIKIARAYTGKKKIIGFKNSYHGQSVEELALTYPPDAATGSASTDFVQIDFPNADQVKSDEEVLNKFSADLESSFQTGDIAAIMAEAGIVTGGGQTNIAPDGFMKIIRELTSKYGVLFILDEVGTGFSRCGKLFGMELEGIVPDIATFAKAISNGAGVIGALVARREIIEKTENEATLISTFGWSPLACAAALKTLEIHQRDKVWVKAQEDGSYIIGMLKEKLLGTSKIKSIRGKGMEIGVLLNDNVNARKIYQELFDNGLIVAIDGNNLQLMPPLTIDRQILVEGIAILIKIIK